MQAQTTARTVIALSAIVLLIAGNYLVFRALENDYLRWYVRNGATIGAITALLAIAWGELDKNTRLISPNPRYYVAACLIVVALPIIVLGNQLQSVGQLMQDRSKKLSLAGLALLLDAILMLPFLLVLFGLLVLWFLVIVPIQYVLFSVCGSLPRALLQSPNRIVARQLEGFSFQTRQTGKEENVPDGWWDASLERRPVTLTALFSSLVLLALKSVLGI